MFRDTVAPNLTHWYTTISRTLLDKVSARRKDLFLTTYITLKRQTSLVP